jgi:Putative transposase
VRWGADQRKELEHLCRYITRPAIANERLKRNRAGDVVLQLKSTFKDGTTHIVMSPLEFMQRLAALVPRPRLHLIRFHGVLAPGAKLRCKIIPSSAERATEASTDDAPAQGAPARMSWARLLKRVFDIDIDHCPNCGGSLKIIAAIEDPPVIVRILTYLGPRPGAASRFIPDNLRAENRLPTQADGAARSEFERKRTQWALTKEEMKNCVWLKPELVAQIEFTEWTLDGHLSLSG